MNPTNQNTQVVRQESRASALVVMGQKFNVEPTKLLTTLKNTVFKGASDDELMALVIVANEYNLNPFKKEIYAFPAKGGGIVPVVGIDGWINIMNSHPKFDGVEFEMNEDEKGEPVSCTAIIHTKDRSKPARVTEYFDECFRATDPWKTMPRRMLRNRALAQCVRIAFTAGGILDEDEAQTLLDPVQQAKPVKGSAESVGIEQAINRPKSRPSETTRAEKTEKTEPKPMPTKKEQLGAWMMEKHYTWANISPVVDQEKVIEGADSIASFDELTEDQATAIFGARTGIEFVLGTGGPK